MFIVFKCQILTGEMYSISQTLVKTAFILFAGSASLMSNHVDSDNFAPPPMKKMKSNGAPRLAVKIDQNFPEARKKRKSDEDSSLGLQIDQIYSETNHERPYSLPEASFPRPCPETCFERSSFYTCPNPVREKDDCDVYGDLLARKLRQMDQRTRDVAMNKIDNLLFKMKMDSYAQQDSQSSHY